MQKKLILHLDMDSFFASVEQQANPFLRGKAIVVSGKEGSRSVIVAASREAKKFGVKTAMAQFEARKLCPDLIFVEGDGEKYSDISRRFVDVLKKYTEKVEVFSIDEAFMDVTGYAKSWEAARVMALQIKQDLLVELGECITCSIGIAENKLLAKLGSDHDKPNGVTIINEVNKLKFLLSSKLTDFCGIGARIKERLEVLGIDSVKTLQSYPVESLIESFGPFYGRKLHDMSFGIDKAPVIADFEAEEVKSVGRSYTLPANTWNKEEIKAVLFHLCEKVGKALREHNQAGRTLVFYFRYEDFTHIGKRFTIPGHLTSGLKLFQLGERVVDKMRFLKSVRLVGVHVSNLVEGYSQMPLFNPEQDMEKVLPFIDKINDKYGELTIKPAALLKLTRLRKRVGGFKMGGGNS